MELVKVKQNYQITIPQSLRKKIKIDVGDYIEIDTQDEFIILRPVKVVHPDQEYFYTKKWQIMEREADKDISQGDVVGPFKDVKASLKALKKSKT
ncbi:MAG: AbrB/MazE/SpoVT family DNA-binding domain-containing protein [Deltaproteobacteria bacterium]|nr:AbrB/MazE/SpoVT family DNA-binding domain-containing protein [Deltaproteobacteria bacterium]MBW2086380.1 AbrB/MazE/SpoVT family DNA-binding domain-containing protein [Deltaproteobacteria bacterium]